MEISLSLNWEQTEHLRESTWLRLASNFSHIEVFSSRLFSVIHFSTVFLPIACFLAHYNSKRRVHVASVHLVLILQVRWFRLILTMYSETAINAAILSHTSGDGILLAPSFGQVLPTKMPLIDEDCLLKSSHQIYVEF